MTRLTRSQRRRRFTSNDRGDTDAVGSRLSCLARACRSIPNGKLLLMWDVIFAVMDLLHGDINDMLLKLQIQ